MNDTDDESALLASHPFDGHPCHACGIPLRLGDPIEFIDDGIIRTNYRGIDWQSLVVVHAACVGPDDVTIMPAPVALPPRPKRGVPKSAEDAPK